MAFAVVLTALAACNALLVPLLLESSVAHHPATPAVQLAGAHPEWFTDAGHLNYTSLREHQVSSEMQAAIAARLNVYHAPQQQRTRVRTNHPAQQLRKARQQPAAPPAAGATSGSSGGSSSMGATPDAAHPHQRKQHQHVDSSTKGTAAPTTRNPIHSALKSVPPVIEQLRQLLKAQRGWYWLPGAGRLLAREALRHVLADTDVLRMYRSITHGVLKALGAGPAPVSAPNARTTTPPAGFNSPSQVPANATCAAPDAAGAAVEPVADGSSVDPAPTPAACSSSSSDSAAAMFAAQPPAPVTNASLPLSPAGQDAAQHPGGLASAHAQPVSVTPATGAASPPPPPHVVAPRASCTNTRVYAANLAKHSDEIVKMQVRTANGTTMHAAGVIAACCSVYRCMLGYHN